jgi:hypothetical protein
MDAMVAAIILKTPCIFFWAWCQALGRGRGSLDDVVEKQGGTASPQALLLLLRCGVSEVMLEGYILACLLHLCQSTGLGNVGTWAMHRPTFHSSCPWVHAWAKACRAARDDGC